MHFLVEIRSDFFLVSHSSAALFCLYFVSKHHNNVNVLSNVAFHLLEKFEETMYDNQSDFIQSVYHEVSSSSIYNHLETPHSNFDCAISFSEAGICGGSLETPYIPYSPSHLEPEGDDTDRLLHNFGEILF